MPLDYPATAVCDRCGRKTSARVVVTRLKPHPEMHLKLPNGWGVSSMPESEELLITCFSCPPVLVSIPPIAVTDAEIISDPATDPTMRPPPLPKKI